MGYTGQAELVAVCDVNADLVAQRAQDFGVPAYTDYHEMLEKARLDGLTVVTPDPYHHDVVLAAAEAGVHVLCEKPLDVTPEGCREMIAACERAGVLLEVDFHKRYDEYHLALRDKLLAGDLGQIQYGYAHMEDRIEVPRDWFPGWAGKSSPAWFLGVHFYDLARFLLGADGVTVWATGQKGRLRELGVDTWDAISAKVVFDNGATVAFDTSWILPEGFEAPVNQGIRLVGTLGFLECDSQDRGTRTWCTDDHPVQQTHNKSFLRLKIDKRGREIWEGYGMDSIADFALNVNELLEGKSLADLGAYPSGADGLEATKIAFGVHRSLETGGIVELATL
jgi:predicted dehydrogenase